MTVKEIASYVAKFEGKKHEASIGDVREIVGILSDLFFKDPSGVITALQLSGLRRAKRKKKSK